MSGSERRPEGGRVAGWHEHFSEDHDKSSVIGSLGILGIENRLIQARKGSGMAKNIYVGNLTWDTNSDDLLQLFSEHGQVTRAQVVSDRETGRSRGFAFVEMPNDSEALAAIDALNDKPFRGRRLRVNEAQPREPRSGGGGGGGSSSSYGGGGGGYGGGGGRSGGGGGGYGGGGGGYGGSGGGGYGGGGGRSGGGGDRGGYGGGGGRGGDRGGGRGGDRGGYGGDRGGYGGY